MAWVSSHGGYDGWTVIANSVALIFVGGGHAGLPMARNVALPIPRGEKTLGRSQSVSVEQLLSRLVETEVEPADLIRIDLHGETLGPHLHTTDPGPVAYETPLALYATCAGLQIGHTDNPPRRPAGRRVAARRPTRADAVVASRAEKWPTGSGLLFLYPRMVDDGDMAKPATDETPTRIRGPYGWINWYAERAGQPRRRRAHPDAVVIRPIWEEFALYTDAPINGPWLQLGPYEVIGLDPVAKPLLGFARKALVLRVWDHLSDEPSPGAPPLRDDVEDYFGGDIGDEFAALLGLVLARRVRSGGSVRMGLPGVHDSPGLPSEMEHHAPALERPRRAPMIPWLAQPVALPDAEPLLSTYPELAAADAVALVRAARQYVDGLWLADADPRLAWIKLIGALEIAANRLDDTREESDLDQLKRHRTKLYRTLRKAPQDVAEMVAGELARLYNVERKLRSFVKRFDPGPPPVRPESAAWHFDWATLDSALTIIYDHRSRDLHDGIAFPWVLCEPPDHAENGVASERFWALGVSGKGGQWTAEKLPMFMHVFAHVAGGALRKWWATLAGVAL